MRIRLRPAAALDVGAGPLATSPFRFQKERAMNIIRAALLLALLSVAAEPAFAQHIYKYRMPDGSMLYTDSQTGFTDQYIKGKLEETIAEPPPAPEQVNAAMRARGEARARNADEAAKAAASGVNAAYAMVVAAREQLQQAERALQAGLGPLPGERLGIVDGHTRLRPAYWARIDKLRVAVEDAQDRLERATNAWIEVS
jgi:hypothetical protein